MTPVSGNMVTLVQAALAILFEAVYLVHALFGLYGILIWCFGSRDIRLYFGRDAARHPGAEELRGQDQRRTRRRSPVTSSSSAWLAPLADPSSAPANLLLSSTSSISRNSSVLLSCPLFSFCWSVHGGILSSHCKICFALFLS